MQQSQTLGGQTQAQGWPYIEPARPADSPEDIDAGAQEDAALPPQQGAGHIAPTAQPATPLPEVPRADASDPAHFIHPTDAPDGVVARPAYAAFAMPEDTAAHLAHPHHAAPPQNQPAMAVNNAREQEKHRRTAELAYWLAEEQHFAPGMAEANWYEAERRLGLSNTASEAF